MTSESAKTSEKEEKEEEPTYEKAIYLIVRNDLKMGKGKIAAQCCHAVQSIVRACPDALYREYEKNGCAKICLKVESEEEFAALAKSLRKSVV